jgi:hypothetical protein
MKEGRVERPLRKSEFEIYFDSRSAKQGWIDFVATRRSEAINAWDHLTQSPLAKSLNNYQLKTSLAFVNRDGESHPWWQYKPNSTSDVRIWFFVVGNKVFLEQVHTHHPNQTKR